MKLIKIVSWLTFITSIGICAPAAPNQTLFEQQQWNYTQKALAQYMCNDRYLQAIDEVTFDDLTFLFATPLSALFLYLWGHKLTDYVRDEYGIENRNAYLALFAMTSYAAINFIHYCVKTISTALSNKQQCNNQALQTYLHNWNIHQNTTPSLLQPLFGQLARYEPFFNTSSYNSAQLLKQIHTTAEKASAITPIIETLQNTPYITTSTGTTTTPHQTSSSIMQQLQLDTCTVSDSEKNKWEYILSQLNILKQPSIAQTWSNTIHQYQWPIIFGFGTPIGLLIHKFIMSHYSQQLSSRISRYAGLLLGISGVALFTQFFGSEETHDKDRLHDAIDFIDNWDYHKAYTPQCLYVLFDKLHQLYVKHHQQLNFHELFIDELYKMLVEIWMHAANPKKHA